MIPCHWPSILSRDRADCCQSREASEIPSGADVPMLREAPYEHRFASVCTWLDQATLVGEHHCLHPVA